MAILQVSDKILQKKYLTLDEYLNKPLHHCESDLYVVNDYVYKIFKSIFRQSREKFVYILTQNKIPHALNIENELYKGDKLIGCSTKLYPNLKTFKELLPTLNISMAEYHDILKVLKQVRQDLQNLNITYLDFNLSNIGISGNDLKVLDLDGAQYNACQSWIENSYFQIYYFYLMILLKENLRLLPLHPHEHNECLSYILNIPSLDILNVKNALDDITHTQKEIYQERLILYKNSKNLK